MHHCVPPETVMSRHSGSLQYQQLFRVVTSQSVATGTAMPLKRDTERAAMEVNVFADQCRPETSPWVQANFLFCRVEGHPTKLALTLGALGSR